MVGTVGARSVGEGQAGAGPVHGDEPALGRQGDVGDAIVSIAGEADVGGQRIVGGVMLAALIIVLLYRSTRGRGK